MKKTESDNLGLGVHSRRSFLKSLGTVAATAATAQVKTVAAELEKANAEKVIGPGAVPVTLTVNGEKLKLMLEPRVTLLDALRNYSSLTGAKEGCDRATCGACTVLVNGRRINSCLSLAVTHEGDEVTTVEGLARGDDLHPVQAAFLEHDGFQCGYCTPGQICSAVALLKEGHARSDAEIREWMSGNLCRCGAYPNIVAAIEQAMGRT